MKTEFAFRQPKAVQLKHVNHRKQYHGDDQVQALDLTMWVDLPNVFLESIQPGLLQALYFNEAGDQGQTDVPDVAPVLPNLRFPKLNGGVFTIMGKKDQFAGYDVAIEYGLGDDTSNMLFDCCKVKLQRIEMKEGGTVRPTFQISYAGDRADGETIGKLIEQEGGEITITLIPPAVATTAEPAEKPSNPMPFDADPEERLTAGDIFGQVHADDENEDDDGPLDSDMTSGRRRLSEEEDFIGGSTSDFQEIPD